MSSRVLLQPSTRRPLVAAISALLLGSSLTDGAAAQDFPAAINVSILNGSNGFRLDGVAAGDLAGSSVSAAGDINGDGIDDLIIGAYSADPDGNAYAGSSYVVFGRSTGFGPVLALSSLDGSNGFRLDGVQAGDLAGSSVSAAGDINGDGIDDLIVGAPIANFRRGTSYVVFGRSTGFGPALALSSLDGSNGFRLDGTEPFDYSGQSVSGAGDINGDGIDDLVIGARREDAGGAGSSYVVFGRTTGFSAALALSSLDGNDGFRIDGVSDGDRAGLSVSAAGDINDDGIDDLLIGTNRPNNYAGRSYVVFGRGSGFGPVQALSSLDGSNGFRLDGVLAYDSSGFSVSAAGDINGDGIDDLLIGAYNADPDGSSFGPGSSYVVFGRRTGFGSLLALSSLDGNTGFRLDGVAERDRSGISVSAAGDINGDGIDDLIIGAEAADPDGNDSAGSSYVVFGRSTGFSPVLALSSLDGSNGFRIDGSATGGLSGRSVSAAGDINGDGIADVIVGAPGVSPNGNNQAGSSYVVFGGFKGPGDVPVLGITPAALNFGNVALGVQATEMLILENVGTSMLLPGTPSLGGPQAGEFSITMNTCSGAQLAAGDTCFVDIGFTPVDPGIRQATLRLDSNAPSSPDFVPLRGSNNLVFADDFE